MIGGFVLNPEDEARVRELGFWLARPYRGQGIMRRAGSHMIQEVRRMVPELRLAASANIDNVRSNRLIRR